MNLLAYKLVLIYPIITDFPEFYFEEEKTASELSASCMYYFPKSYWKIEPEFINNIPRGAKILNDKEGYIKASFEYGSSFGKARLNKEI